MNVVDLRRYYGDVYASVISDSMIIPWRVLTMDEFIGYQQLIALNKYPLPVIQDEIFRKCVVDDYYNKSADTLPAGIVGVVVEGIWANSGPSNVHDLTLALNAQRNRAQDVLHQIVSWICQAFPAYKPEDLYAMEYPDLMLRLAQAEDKLLKFNLITEPFNFSGNIEEPQPKAPQPKGNKKPKVDIRKLREEFNKQKVPQQASQAKPTKRIIQQDQEQTIITAKEMKEHELVLDGHEKDVVYLHKQTEATAEIYKDYLEQMSKDGKLRIKTVEERIEEANKRMEENKRRAMAAAKKAKSNAEVELEELKKRREAERKRRTKLKTR